MHKMSIQEIREVYGYAQGLSVQKSRTSLDKHSRAFIAMSPFLVIATSNAAGRADTSPRGDPPGFVHILDDHHIVIPDRPGNNRLDTIENITSNPNVSCLFFIPGFDDTLRIVGKAFVTNDRGVLKNCIVQGKEPKTGIVVEVEEAFLHCAKALRRSRLWSEDAKQDRNKLPSIARIILDQVCETEVDEKEAAAADREVEDNYRNEMY